MLMAASCNPQYHGSFHDLDCLAAMCNIFEKKGDPRKDKFILSFQVGRYLKIMFELPGCCQGTSFMLIDWENTLVSIDAHYDNLI